MFSANSTATRATETGRSPTRVSLRTRLAAAKAFWKSRPRIGPQLTEDLGLAHHHRIQRRGHPHHVAHGVAAGVLVEVLSEISLVRTPLRAPEIAAEEAVQPVSRVLRRAGERDYLDPIAGREQNGLFDLVAGDELLERRHGVLHREALAQLERRALVVGTE
jgi:hypothetical protein